MSSDFSLQGKTVCVVDVYGLLYQVFHAPGMEMTNSVGEPTGATFGFVRDVFSIMTKLRPNYLFCAFDMHAKTFRSEIYPEYKANRSATPDDLLLQFDFAREFLKGIGVPALGVVGWEADDILATMAKRTEELGGTTILATSDKDARQLLSDSTSIYLLRKEKYYRAPELLEDWGIAPNQVVDFQALVGDSSDNVPGVPLIGPKVASELLAKYQTLEGVFQGAIGQKGKRYENIRNSQELALISRRLVKLRDDVPIELDWEAGRLNGVDPERLKGLFKYWNFRSFLSKVDALAEQFGIATAEPSEWFDKIDAQRRDFLRESASNEGGPQGDAPKTLFAFSETSSDESKVQPSVGGAFEFDAQTPLVARFAVSQYGSPTLEPRRADESARDANDGTALVGACELSVLDALDAARPIPPGEARATLVDTDAKLTALAERLRSARLVSIATTTLESVELGRVRPRLATLCGLALAVDPTEAFYLPFRAPLGAPRLDVQKALDALKSTLESPEIAKIGFELKYDALVLRDRGTRLRGLAFDVAIADHVVRSGDVRRELSDVASTYLDVEPFDLKAALGSGRSKVALDALEPSVVARSAADAVLIPLNAAPILRAKLRETPGFERLATDLETPLIELLAEMEYNGLAFDAELFRKASAELLARQEKLEREIRDAIADVDPEPDFAETINLNSPKQLQRLLFDDLHLRVVRKNSQGASVDAKVLEELADEHPIPRKIVELRKLVKLRGTYLEPLPSLAVPSTGRICATFHQASTATGRLSSSDPNLQNIPARSDDGKLIRSGFAPDKSLGFDAFVSCDYSQIELRLLAHFSQDEALLRAFAEDADAHTIVASNIFGVAPSEVTPDMRRKAKVVNFGLVYGQTAFGLSKVLGISTSEASAYIDAFFATHPGVLEFFDRVLDDCAQRGYVQTALGRRRALSGVRGARGRKTLNFPERAAINAVVQGAAADLMKMAMLAVWRRLRREGWIQSKWSSEYVDPIVNGPLDAAPLFAVEPSGAAPLFIGLDPDPAGAIARTTVGGTRERARLLLQIHDELLFETRREDADELAKIVVEEMKLGDPLSAPLKVDASIGANWGEL